MQVIVNISLKNGILDPQAQSIEKALHSLNFNTITKLSISKQIKIELNENDKNKAYEKVKAMCEELLVNSVIEEYELIL